MAKKKLSTGQKRYMAEMKVWLKQLGLRIAGCRNGIKNYRKTIEVSNKLIELEEKQAAIIQEQRDQGEAEFEQWKKERGIK